MRAVAPKRRFIQTKASNAGAAMTALTLIAFDADDTLWHNETHFRMTQGRIEALLADFTDPTHLHDQLMAAERRNMGRYGFGVKGFMLSMIETAIEVTQGRVEARVIAEILSAGRDLLDQPIEVLPHAEATLRAMAMDHQVIIITKGDLLDQERKVAQSGLAEILHGVEIVSDKTPAAYLSIFTRYGHRPSACMMVGNSMKSDVLPAIAVGAHGVHVPQELTWAFEIAPPPKSTPQNAERFHTIAGLNELQGLVAGLKPLP
jgi:putative hydrolase of the HAD superfamily